MHTAGHISFACWLKNLIWPPQFNQKHKNHPLMGNSTPILSKICKNNAMTSCLNTILNERFYIHIIIPESYLVDMTR